MANTTLLPAEHDTGSTVPRPFGEKMIENVQWLGYGSFLIKGSPKIYINPWRTARTDIPADIILISHHHYESCSIADIERLRADHTVILAPERVAQEIPGCTILRAWQSMTFGRVCIKAVPAYHPTDPLHSQKDGGLGFVISMNFYDLYYAGDTGLTPELLSVRPDIAILPIDGEGTLNAEEAAEAVAAMRPRIAIPCNWGTGAEAATRVDAGRFESAIRALSPNVQVLVLKPER